MTIGSLEYDIRFYGCTNHAENDVSTQGGSIDRTVILTFDEPILMNGLNDTIDVYSLDNTDTTQTLTITGRNSSGTIISENYNINGTTVQFGSTIFQQVLKIVCSASHAGDLVFVDNTNSKVLGRLLGTTNAPGGIAELTLRRPFYDIRIPSTGTNTYYEKIFLRNNSAFSYYYVNIYESGDKWSSVTFALASSQNDSESVSNRTMAPSLVSGPFNNDPKSIPNTHLNSGDAIGVWLKIDIPAGRLPDEQVYGFFVQGKQSL